MDEEQLLEDIRIVDEDMKRMKERAEEIGRQISGTSDPEGTSATSDVIHQKEILLLQQKTILLQERAILRGQGEEGSRKRLKTSGIGVSVNAASLLTGKRDEVIARQRRAGPAGYCESSRRVACTVGC